MSDYPLTFGEYVTRESPTLAEIFRDVFNHLRTRDDVALFGSHAVNAYVDPPRMTADINIMSTHAQDLAEEISLLLHEDFHIAMRVRSVARGFRIFQVRREGNRHLVDVQQVDELPRTRIIEGVSVTSPEDLLRLKLESYAARKNTEKGLSDKLDIYRMLRTFPELGFEYVFQSVSGPVKTEQGPVFLVSPAARKEWLEILDHPIEPTNSDEY